MATFLIIIHVIVSLFLIFIVLIQGGKGAELGAAFGGGSSQTLFGSRGAATFLGKLTTVVAIVFMVTSLLLAIVSVRGTSIIKQTVPAAERSAAPAPGVIPQGQIPTESQVPLTPGETSAPEAPAVTTPAAPQPPAEQPASK